MIDEHKKYTYHGNPVTIITMYAQGPKPIVFQNNVTNEIMYCNEETAEKILVESSPEFIYVMNGIAYESSQGLDNFVKYRKM